MCIIRKICVLITVALSLLGTVLKANDGETSPTKTIFISDIHMCDYSTIHPTSTDYHPYGWLGKKHATMLAKFLNQQEQDESVEKVVILGDLFDGWVCPFDMDPLYGTKSVDAMFEKMGSTDIQTNPINAPIVKALQTLASEKRLIYVPGNHDMLLTKETLQRIIPGIIYRNKYISDDGVIVAEHGHDYCLFNAIDNFDNKDNHILPLGYFVTRAASYKAAYDVQANGEIITTPEVFKNIYTSITAKDTAPDAIIDVSKVAYLAAIIALGRYYIWPNTNPIATMNKMDGFKDITMVDGVVKRYGKSSSNWPEEQKNISATSAFKTDAGLLEIAAEKVYKINHLKGLPKIVIFGHTHHAKLINYWLGLGKIYANSGTWIDRTDECTYVETKKVETKKSGNIHTVKVYEYNEDGSSTEIEFL